MTLSKEIFIKKSGLHFIKNKVTEYNYSDTNDFICNTIIERAFSPYQEPTYNNAYGLYIGFYKTYSIKQNLKSIITTDYIDSVSVNSIDDSSCRKVISKKTYNYGSLVGLPIETYNSISNENKVLKTVIHYPNGAPDLSDLDSAAYSNYWRLFSSHILSKPIQVENYIGYFFFL